MRILTGVLLVAAAFWCQSAQSQTVTVLKAARLFDGKTDTLVEPGLVVINGNKITALGGAVPAGAKVIDLGDATLLPASSIRTPTSPWPSTRITTGSAWLRWNGRYLNLPSGPVSTLARL